MTKIVTITIALQDDPDAEHDRSPVEAAAAARLAVQHILTAGLPAPGEGQMTLVTGVGSRTYISTIELEA